MPDWKTLVVGKRIKSVSVDGHDEFEDMEIIFEFDDGSTLTLLSSGHSEGVTADGTEINTILSPH